MLIQLWAICPRLADNCYIYLPFNKHCEFIVILDQLE